MGKTGSELFIVDNSDQNWKVLNYLRDWCQLSKAIDIASGYFEIGSLLALDGEWQKVDKIRILMGDEVSLRTKNAFIEGLEKVKKRLDESIEISKEKNDFLLGVPAIVDAIRSGKIECKVYRKEKFHAKAYITHARQTVVGSFGLVGSSNFTYPGLNENVELNVQIAGTQVKSLQDWYDDYWKNAEDITPEILHVVERHTREYLPFDIYAKALQEYFRGHEMTATEWEQTKSKMYSVLDQYQKEGYQSLMKIAKQYNGAFLCDGVGLGKTFVGLMAIERLIMHDRKRVALFVPKAARADVWERALRQYIPDVGGVSGGDFSNLAIFNHTDLGREGEFPDRFRRIKELVDVIVIDEAHHFRNPGIAGIGEKRKPSRYRRLFELLETGQHPKQLLMLTATPINNQLDDLRHMVELFSQKDDGYFKTTLGIHSLRGHFVSMERSLKKVVEVSSSNDDTLDTNIAEAERILKNDNLFQALVVQRSRAYVTQSQRQEGGNAAIFPERHPPKVKTYSIKKTYGKVLTMIEEAFAKSTPLFTLGIYYPLFYYKGERPPEKGIDNITDQTFKFRENRQKQVVSLIRIQFLKRLESSAHGFECSCQRLFIKLLTWMKKHSETEAEKKRMETWERQHAELIKYVHESQHKFWDFGEEADLDEDIITDEMLEEVEYLNRDEYRVEDILADTYLDLDELVAFLQELRNLKTKDDDKLRALINLLQTDPVLKKEKVLIFTEFAETARYLARELKNAGIDGLYEIDSSTDCDRGEILRRFAPYYNGASVSELKAEKSKEIRVLISTDILAEGLNLQDATRLINYDLHWNPVRLMQRIGRVDRRMNPNIEKKILEDHPDQKDLRGKVEYWNFLPPDELENLIRLYSRVSHKTLRISKTFGIEGKKLLTPEDDYEALREFNQKYEGNPTLIEEMHLEYQKLLKQYPDLASKLELLPGRVYSGKENTKKGMQAVFFCYRLLRPDQSTVGSDGEPAWTEEAGETKWILFDISTGDIIEEPADIIKLIRSKSDTPRRCLIDKSTLTEIRIKVEKWLTNTYLKKLQAPIGIKPILKAWMELN